MIEGTESSENNSIMEEKTIINPNTVPILFHEKKQSILKLLIEKEMNIIDLKNVTKLNPGTIKRHINDLVTNDLAELSTEKVNKFGINMKYYRATAKKFLINIKWP